MIESRMTLTAPAAALAAAEKLWLVMGDLNAANLPYALQQESHAYQAAHDALWTVLATMADEENLAAPRAEAFARFILDGLAESGETVEYHVTQILGWTLVLTVEPGAWDDGAARTVPGKPDGYAVPAILGGNA